MATKSRKRRTLPRTRWTNPLAWAVWNQRRLNKIRGWVGDVAPEICRYYHTFDGIDDHVATPELSIVGGFELSVDIKTLQVLNDFAISDSSKFLTGNQGDCLVYIDNPDGLQLVIGDGVGGFERHIFGGQVLIANGDVNNIRLVRSGDNVTALINNSQIGIARVVASPLVVFEGLWFGGDGRNMAGVGSNLKIYKDGDKDTGTLVRDYPLDDNSNIIIDRADGQNGTLINSTSQQWSFECDSGRIPSTDSARYDNAARYDNDPRYDGDGEVWGSDTPWISTEEW